MNPNQGPFYPTSYSHSYSQRKYNVASNSNSTQNSNYSYNQYPYSNANYNYSFQQPNQTYPTTQQSDPNHSEKLATLHSFIKIILNVQENTQKRIQAISSLKSFFRNPENEPVISKAFDRYCLKSKCSN
jgi:hypothetical protein